MRQLCVSLYYSRSCLAFRLNPRIAALRSSSACSWSTRQVAAARSAVLNPSRARRWASSASLRPRSSRSASSGASGDRVIYQGITTASATALVNFEGVRQWTSAMASDQLSRPPMRSSGTCG